MPSQKASIALIDLYFAANGAPWNWLTWQEITGIHHGLFPKSDNQLPPGWTRQKANDIHSWFVYCHRTDLRNPENGAASMPGEKSWDGFIHRNWESWKLHPMIVTALRECGVHPFQIIMNESSRSIENVEWPRADLYAPNAFEAVGVAIFGSDGLGKGDLFPLNIRRCIGVMIQRTWARIRGQFTRDVGRIDFLEGDALAAFDRKYPPPPSPPPNNLLFCVLIVRLALHVRFRPR